VEGLYAFNFNCSVNLSRAARFSLLNFHAGEFTMFFVFPGFAGITALTFSLFSRYSFSAMVVGLRKHHF
jgi:hypothetical protein